MCGVTGIISLNSNQTDKDLELCERMTSLLIHRGPSQQGIITSKRFTLGNTRLSIIDPTPQSKLPMYNNDKSVIITYNGEVSNFRELKEKYKLEEKFKFHGKSDTEVVLRLYELLGIDFLQELSGMFAFGLVDRNKNKAFVVRDFYGINPMFYRVSNERIYFASEIKSLLEVDNSKTVNSQGIFDFLTLAYIPGIQTPYEEIKELRGGELIEIDLQTGENSTRRYYEIKFETDYSITEEVASKKAYDLMYDSVERNLISDKPIGTTLSGGIDTSTMTCLVKDMGRSKDFHTFSIKMGEKSFDESPYQKIIADFCQTNHHEILVTPEDVIENIYHHMAHIDEPNGDGSAIPSFILAQKAKSHVDVLLSGEGGDEVFNAYSVYNAWKIRKHYVNYTPSFLRKLIKNFAHALPSNFDKLSLDFQMKRFTEGCELHPAAAHLFWRHPLRDQEKNKVFLNSDKCKDTYQIGIDLYNKYSHREELNRISMLDFEHFFVDDLLVKNDRMFMANSIETRFPLMDRHLVEYLNKVPPSLRLKGLRGRNIQKNAMKNSIPKEILARKNYGLEMPHSIWFLDKFMPFAKKYLNKKRVEATGLLSWPEVENLWNQHLAKKVDHGRGLWCIIMFLIWHEMFIEKSNYKSYLIGGTKFSEYHFEEI
jgi:asparagine synthase (glutamine-hydrolysing)